MDTSTHKGFTLVETLVAITVVTMAMVGPFYAVQQALNASWSARDQLIASSLAQEGVEYVRGLRDGNYLYNLANASSPRSWLYGVDGTGGTRNCIAANCVVDVTQNTVSTTVGPLYLSTTNLYNQAGSGTATRFTRTVRLIAVSGSSTEMTVRVTVSWTTRGVARSIVIDESLHNWL